MKKDLKLIPFLVLVSFIFCSLASAEELKSKDAKDLSKCACSATSAGAGCLKDLKNMYFKDNRYADFIDLLKGLCPDNPAVAPAINYYTALSRYSQLKYLEEAKGWDEYFAKGNEYREDVLNYAQKAIAAASPKDQVAVYARLLAYQFHKDQQDSLAESALTDLMSSVAAYAQSTADIETIKEAADKLYSYGEKVKADEIYKIYAAKLSSAQIQDKGLKDIADKFYQEGNLELAGNIYDIYIQRISGAFAQDELIKELAGIAGKFAYRDNAPSAPAYAEKIFKKIEDIGGKDAFNEGLMYLRGFNLEKYKAYAQAKDIYLAFIEKFPASKSADKLIYKVGIIYTYVLRDVSSGRNYFNRLLQKNSALTYDLAALYQLGLLRQWEGANSEAKSYYDRLLQKIGNTDTDRLALTQERLKEITQGLFLDYNLKTGLDTALKAEYANLDMSKVELKANLYEPARGEEVTLDATPDLGPSGCLQVELQYLWSGDTGGVKPAPAQSKFKTSYKSAGTQVIILVLVSPEGITERAVDLIDVR